MKKVDCIKFNTPPAEAGGEGFPPEEENYADIDALIRLTAERCNARVDFPAIKARVLAGDTRRRKRERLYQRFALGAAACLMLFGVSVIAVSLAGRHAPNGNSGGKTVLGTAGPQFPSFAPELSSARPEPSYNFKGSFTPRQGGESGHYVSCVYMGAAGNASVESVSAALKKELPDYMSRRVNKISDKTMAAKGTDEKGRLRCCECTIMPFAPYRLSLGQLGELSSGSNEDYVFYWQSGDKSCLMIHLSGFGKTEAVRFINAIIKSMIGRQ